MMAGPDTRKGGVGSVALVHDFRLRNFEIRHRTTRDLNPQVLLFRERASSFGFASIRQYEETGQAG
ncbi:hypothetical protein [Cupriavidus sp. PET2-C1]